MAPELPGEPEAPEPHKPAPPEEPLAVAPQAAAPFEPREAGRAGVTQRVAGNAPTGEAPLPELRQTGTPFELQVEDEGW
jgi:hypothetical protein